MTPLSRIALAPMLAALGSSMQAFASVPSEVQRATTVLGSTDTSPRTSPTWTAAQGGESLAIDLPDGLRAEIDERGLAVHISNRTNSGAAAGWGLRMRSTSFGTTRATTDLGAGVLRQDGERVSVVRPGLVEWYEPLREGLEQGWTIASAPEAAAEHDLELGFAVEGDLVMRIFEGGRTASFVDFQAQPRLYARELRAFDAGGRELDTRFSVGARGLSIQVDARGAQYPVTIDPLIASMAWSFETNQDNVPLLVGNAGDVNGDGFSDIVVASLLIDTPLVDAGRAWVFHGGPNGPSMATSWTAEGDVAGRMFGAAANTTGDVNDDGFDDLAIGALGTGTGSVAGAVYVWYGGPGGLGANGTTSNADFVFTEAAAGDFRYAGTPAFYTPDNQLHDWLNTAGDVNNDGIDDLLVGAPGYDGSVTDQGRAYVFFGAASPTGLTTANRWEYSPSPPGLNASSGFGASVSTAGDVNGDGFDDILIGAPLWDEAAANRGKVFAFYGSTSFATDFTADWSKFGPNGESACPGFASTYFGHSVSTVGDMNGDGYADIAIGEPGAECHVSEADEGYLHVHFGSQSGISLGVSNAIANRFVYSNDPQGFWGWSVCAAGDVDGDGFADLVAGTTGHDDYFSPANDYHGAVFLEHGSTTYGGPDGLHGSGLQQRVDVGPHDGAILGDFVSGAGDVDGDGLCDVTAATRAYDNGGNVNEGRATLYLGRPKPTVARANLAVTGAAASNLGAAVQTAGDFQLDGYNDLIVGAPEYSNGEAQEGQARVYAGGRAALVVGAPVWQTESGEANARFGAAVSGGGDIDNDGDGDIVVGAPGWDGTLPTVTDQGRLYAFHTVGGIIQTAPAWTFASGVAGSELGSSVAFAGDVNADGFADLIAGAPRYSSVQIDAGRAYLFLGSPTGFGADPAWTYECNQANARFGSAVASAGDVNGDGYCDVLVGAPMHDNTNPDEGRVFIFLGASAGLSNTPTWLDGGSPDGRFGTALALLGDIDRDARVDVAIGAPGTEGGPVLGRVQVYLGAPTGLLSVAHSTLTGPAGTLFGAAVSGGDMNGDGFPELIVGEPAFDGAQTDQGRVSFFVGGSSSYAFPAALDYLGSPGTRSGTALNIDADFDGDRLMDVVSGAPGDNGGAGIGYLYSGGPAVGSVRRTNQRRTLANGCDLYGESNTLGQFQVTGESPQADDGYSSIEQGHGTPGGRDDILLEFEVKPAGTTFNGAYIQHTGDPQDSGFPRITAPTEITTLHADVTELALGVPLTLQTRYLWRVRVATSNPYFPHGRWSNIHGNGLIAHKLGTGTDCNNNGVEDTIEAQNPANDCNGNLAPDSCDIASGFELDCDGNTTPDSCQLLANDCNGNGVPDSPCEIGLPGANCNANSFLDSCEIASNPALDVNGDGVIDTCQFDAYCFGDGSGTPCPCTNSGSTGRGCANSLNANGALLAMSGIPSISNDTLVLLGSGMTNSTAIYLQGTLQDDPGTALQDGLRCVIGSIVRLGTRQNVSGQSQYPDVGNQPVHIRGAIASPGTWHYQAFYRNAAAAFCPPGTANWTNGLSVAWAP